MYSYLFCFLFYLVKDRNPDAKFAAASIVAASQLGHFLFFNAIIKLFFKLPIIQFSNIYFYNKIMWMPIAIIWLIFVHIFFKKNFDRIMIKYEGKSILNFKNSMIVCCLIFLPFISALFIFNYL